jgi:hypothetical protein
MVANEQPHPLPLPGICVPLRRGYRPHETVTPTIKDQKKWELETRKNPSPVAVPPLHLHPFVHLILHWDHSTSPEDPISSKHGTFVRLLMQIVMHEENLRRTGISNNEKQE